ncbi:MAG: ABC transporter ATP-binding protein [Bacteroidales bacterium]|nr:ABC transporter ATP-binding protein [Bacteroidales bacterium]
MTRRERQFIFKYAKPYIFRYIAYIFLVILMSVFSICSILSVNNFLQILFVENPPAPTSELDVLLNRIYSYFLVFGKQKALVYFTLIILTVYFLKDLFEWLSEYYMGCTRNKITRNIRSALFSDYIHKNLSFFSKHKKGDLLSRISADVTEYDETVLKSIQTVINSIVIVLMYIIILFYIEWKLTLITLLLFPLVASLTSVLSHKLRSSSKRLQATNGLIVSLTEQTIGGLRIIKSLTAIDYVNQNFRKINKDYTVLRNKVYRMVDLPSPLSEVLSSIVVAVILLIGSNIVMTGTSLSSTMFIVYLILFILIIKPAKDTSTAFYNMKKGSASIERISEIESVPAEIEEKNADHTFPVLKKGIIFKNLSFSYGDNKQAVLKNINCIFEKGKTTAIVGPSGSGKTTMIDLIEKFYLPSEGDIYFDDTSIREIHSSQIRENIAIVGQETILFNDSIKNNISFSSKNYSFEQVKKAAQIANAEEFILKLPKQYNTNIGDKGDKLSGGQKQRIAIARAVLKETDILILDEATSALDNKSEVLVQQALNNISKDKTVIIIAHRLSTVKNADKIIVLSDGEIKEEGTHEELYKKQGLYYKLSSMQEL